MISAGPLSRTGEQIRQAMQQPGLGAVVTKTINRLAGSDALPTMSKVGRNGLLNHAWADVGFDRWVERELPIALEGGLPLIASVTDRDPTVLADMARQLQDMGASMIETPMHGGDVAAATTKVDALKRTLDVPVVVKVGPDIPDITGFAQAVVEAGADVISGINTLGPGLAIDIDSGRPRLGTAGGIGHLSGAPIKPLAVAYTAALAQAVDVPVWAGGGVFTGADALELMMVGASCAHVHTAAMLRGLDVFSKISNDIGDFLQAKGLSTLDPVVGSALPYLERGASTTIALAEVDESQCNMCKACHTSCLYGAIRLADVAVVVEENCSGCGLCVTVCPTDAVSLRAIS
jgi:dihydroorotate dehydrogenase/Pyruvate/2-oxoacid:ferredoxin oxidoreductase delta subunit